MAEIAPLTRLICGGCSRNFDNANDLAPARIGTQLVDLCRRCYQTALGVEYSQKQTFEAAKELAGQPVVVPAAAAALATARRG